MFCTICIKHYTFAVTCPPRFPLEQRAQGGLFLFMHMAKKRYTKPALSYKQQLEQLKSRGLQVEDDSKALHLLENISYYRLSGYFYPLLAVPKKNHLFKDRAKFSAGFELYCFDRALRKLLWGELEKIEVAVRAKMIYILSHQHGSFWFQNASLFRKNHTWNKTVNQKFTKDFADSDEQFIQEFKQNYSDPMPPSWMMLEITSFGSLSSLYSNLKPGRTKREIAHYFGLDDRTFASWLHTFVYVRNICAHHSRLWNRELSISPIRPTNPSNDWILQLTMSSTVTGAADIELNKRTYFLMCMIQYMLNIINPKNSFKSRFLNLFSEHLAVDERAMGFPEDWQKEKLWKNRGWKYETVDENSVEKLPWPSYIPDQADKLILGTFPTDRKKRSFQFFYPNLNNPMWKVLAHLANHTLRHFDDSENTVKERKEILDTLKLAMSDIGKRIMRQSDSSNDSALFPLEYTDVFHILEQNIGIKKIIITSVTGENSVKAWLRNYFELNGRLDDFPNFDQGVKKGSFQFEGRPIEITIVSSTSKNARKSFEDLTEMYGREICD